eukprot:scaffold6023_cov119-Isochrysis_galbana.AAC.1
MEAAQRLRKAHCDKLLKLYRKSHEKDGLKIVHVIGDGYCAYNCFSLALHLSDGSAEKLQADFIEWLWTDLGLCQTDPTELYVDNTGAEMLAKERKVTSRSRHITRRYLKQSAGAGVRG